MWFLFLMLFTSPFNSQWSDVTKDPDVMPYVQEFVVEAAAHGVSVNPRDYWYIRKSDNSYFDGTTTIGYCLLPMVGLYRATLFTWPWHKSIEFRREWWDTASEKLKRITVFHELGHCSLRRNHEPMGTASIMEPRMPEFEESDWDYLVEELFDPKKFGNATFWDPNDIDLTEKK